MKVGEKIKRIRKMAGMTQEELAEKMNVSRQTISKWEKEISSPDLESAIILCDLFEISLDDFLKGGQDVEREEKISLKDMMKINRRNQKMTILLISSLFFIMIGALAAIFIAALNGMTMNIEYILYRYIATGQYTNTPIDYWRLNTPVILLIIIGIILGMAYVIERWKEKNGNKL